MENLLLLLNSKLIDANKHVEVFNQFKKLHTYEEYIKFSLCLMYEYEIIPKCNLMRKDAKASEKMRDHGNRIFTDPLINENKFLEAYKKYTIAIALAPHFSRQLALAYANRSAVLFQLKKFQDCIQDINRALSMDYPNDIKGKLFLRKSECLIKLGHEPIKEELDEATKYLDRLPDDNANKGKLESNLKLMREGKITKLIEKLGDRERMQELPKIEKPNEEAPCVSDAVAIKYNENYGRHIVAARKILPGEILLVEKPYSTLLCNDYSYTHCSNCMNIVWASIPCENCTHVVYCSEECKNLHWKKYHDFECTIVSIIKDSMLMVDLFSLRLAVQSIKEVSNWRELKAEVNEVDNWQDPRTKGFCNDGKFYSHKYTSVASLVTNKEKRMIQDLFRKTMDSCYILYFLATQTNFFGTKFSEDLKSLAEDDFVVFVGGLILRHQLIIPANIHTVYKYYNDDFIERSIEALPFSSLINHSCTPNTVRSTDGDCTVLYALYPIEKDDQIFDNYGQHYALCEKNVRQETLLKEYQFRCGCIACKEDWPLYQNTPSYEILVKNQEDREQIKRALSGLALCVDLVSKYQMSELPAVIEDLLKMIETLYELSPIPCVELNRVVEVLKRAYELYGNRFILKDR